MNAKESLIQYYDDLLRFALSKCPSQQDAEDLVSDTLLSAFEVLHKGGKIEFPKTWLANTLMHKWNGLLRQRYRAPTIVQLDSLSPLSEPLAEIEYDDTDEALELRSELSYLARLSRNVLIRYYYWGQSVPAIAAALNIPEGTVKSRLYAGRLQLKKGLTDMTETPKGYLPGHLNLSYSGGSGTHDEPISLVENDLIAQNLLILAYNKPKSIPELARTIGIPTAYIEPVIEKLINGELMVCTKNERVYSDFVIYKPEDYLQRIEAQEIFIETHFDIFWNELDQLLTALHALPFCSELRPRQLKKLERHLLLRVLQKFTLESCPDLTGNLSNHSPRRDGGTWCAMGWAFSADFNADQYYQKIQAKYTLSGLRHLSAAWGTENIHTLHLYEFDTSLWDSPHRHAVVETSMYFKDICQLLFCAYKGIEPEDKVNFALIEAIPSYIELGLLTRKNGRLTVDIPVLSIAEYNEAIELVNAAFKHMSKALGENYRKLLLNQAISLPLHLKSVPDFQRYLPAYHAVIMGIIYKAYDRRLHLHDVHYCCPPVVLVVE